MFVSNENSFSITALDINAMARAYPRMQLFPGRYEARLENACTEFKLAFGERCDYRIFSAPGRSEIGGNHTDHQHGCVLAAAIDLDIIGVAAPNGTNIIRMQSEGYGLFTLDISDMQVHASEVNTSHAILRGIASRINEMGYKVQGFDIYVTSDVPKGSGISSSAAFEVLLGAVMNGLFCESRLSPVEIAQIGQYAENVYFGKPSGLMDQMASSVGGAVAIDFIDPDMPIIKRIEARFPDANYSFVMVNSGADHADLTDEYGSVTNEMRAVASLFGKQVLRHVDANSFYSNINYVRKELGDRAALRAMHFFAENDRAILEAELLTNGDFNGFFQTLLASGRSSFMYLQNVSVAGRVKDQAMAVALALCEHLLNGCGAFRVQGGGFAGAIQAFVPNNMLQGFIESMEQMLFKGCCTVVAIRQSGAIELTKRLGGLA